MDSLKKEYMEKLSANYNQDIIIQLTEFGNNKLQRVTKKIYKEFIMRYINLYNVYKLGILYSIWW